MVFPLLTCWSWHEMTGFHKVLPQVIFYVWNIKEHRAQPFPFSLCLFFGSAALFLHKYCIYVLLFCASSFYNYQIKKNFSPESGRNKKSWEWPPSLSLPASLFQPFLPLPFFFLCAFQLLSVSVSSGLYYLSSPLAATVPGWSSKTSVSKKAGTVNGPQSLGLFTRALGLN